jgi:hypothetical protein
LQQKNFPSFPRARSGNPAPATRAWIYIILNTCQDNPHSESILTKNNSGGEAPRGKRRQDWRIKKTGQSRPVEK